MGHAACSCDLIVRKKQFPPVFWQRLYNYEATSGSKLIAEVTVITEWCNQGPIRRLRFRTPALQFLYILKRNVFYSTLKNVLA
jgi:hypothetical protein